MHQRRRKRYSISPVPPLTERKGHVYHNKLPIWCTDNTLTPYLPSSVTLMKLLNPLLTMEEMGEFSPIFPLLINSITTTSSNRFRSARTRLFATGIAATTTMGSRIMAKLSLFLPCAVDHGARLRYLIRSYLIYKGTHQPLFPIPQQTQYIISICFLFDAS